MVGLGISCQGSYQIGTHAPLLRELIGSQKTAKHLRTPLDWVICPPRSVARMIRDWRFHPSDPTQIVSDQAPYWPEGECWFWHDEPHITSGEFLPRQDHFVSNFEGLGALANVNFVLSNTQGNLDLVMRQVRHPIDIAFSDADVDAVEAAVKARFPKARLWVVVRKDRNLLQRHRHSPRVFELEPEPSEWKGDSGQWEAVFRRMLAPAA